MDNHNEYVKDVYGTNKVAHFKNILMEQGFILSEIGEVNKIDKATKKEMAKYEVEIDEVLWNKFLTMTDSERTDNKADFKHIIENMEPECLNLFGQSNDILIKFKKFILDNKAKNNYFSTMAILKTDEYKYKIATYTRSHIRNNSNRYQI